MNTDRLFISLNVSVGLLFFKVLIHMPNCDKLADNFLAIMSLSALISSFLSRHVFFKLNPQVFS